MARIRQNLSEEYLSLPYENDKDPLNRYDQAERIANMFATLEHGSVAILNGRWGSGKTTFARKLIAHLRGRGLSATYFNAFSKDYADSPFLALNAHIANEISSLGNSHLPVSIEIKKASKEVAKKLGAVSAKILVKAITLGAVGASEIDEVTKLVEDISDGAGEVASSAAEDLIDRYIEIEEGFGRFRESLNGLAEALAANKDNAAAQGCSKVVFIIDELDRCRPDFALGVIETIKHLFDNDSVHFLLVTNTEYLVASINAQYGLDEKSSEYLEKFYDFQIFFEVDSGDRFRHASSSIVARRIQFFLGERNDHEASQLVESLQVFARGFDLSLRQASALATNASLAYLSGGTQRVAPILIATLALYRTKFPHIYQAIKRKNHTASLLLSPFEAVKLGDDHYDKNLIEIIRYYSAVEGEIDRNDPKYKGFSSIIPGYWHNPREALSYIANEVVDSFGSA